MDVLAMTWVKRVGRNEKFELKLTDAVRRLLLGGLPPLPAKAMHTPLLNRRFQFGIGTLLVLTAIIAILLAYPGTWIRERRAAIRDGRVSAASQLILHTAGGKVINDAPAPWPLRLFGEMGFVRVYVAENATEEEIAQAKKLFPEAEIKRATHPSLAPGANMRRPRATQ
jgi:hypothetical protein